MNFYTALELLETARNKSAGKPIGRNTRLIWIDEHTIGLTLHDNIIIQYHDDMSITLDSCGWQTVTTKDRLNNFTPFSIYQRSKQWYVEAPDGKEFYFKDGMILYQTAVGWTADKTLTDAEMKQKKAVEKMIEDYITKFVNNLPIEAPSVGDCWYCVMGNENGITVGDLSGDHDHLMSHIDEEYFVPALLYNALIETGKSDYGITYYGYFDQDKDPGSFNGYPRNDAKRALRNYLYKRLIIQRERRACIHEAHC